MIHAHEEGLRQGLIGKVPQAARAPLRKRDLPSVKGLSLSVAPEILHALRGKEPFGVGGKKVRNYGKRAVKEALSQALKLLPLPPLLYQMGRKPLRGRRRAKKSRPSSEKVSLSEKASPALAATVGAMKASLSSSGLGRL